MELDGVSERGFQGAVDGCELFERHRFGTEGWGEICSFAGGVDAIGGDTPGAQVIEERLALLLEAGLEEGVEGGGLDVELGETGMDDEPQDGGVDVGRGSEGCGRQREEVVDLGIHLSRCREQAEVARARCRGDAVCHLALHHDDGHAERGVLGEEMQQDVRRNVVGQVANDVGGFAGLQIGAEVSVEDVGFDDLYVGVVAIVEGEFGGEGAVEFDADQALGAFGEDAGNGAVAWADFNHSAVGDVAQGVGDAMARGVIGEEVLSEFGLAGLGHVGLRNGLQGKRIHCYWSID